MSPDPIKNAQGVARWCHGQWQAASWLSGIIEKKVARIEFPADVYINCDCGVICFTANSRIQDLDKKAASSINMAGLNDDVYEVPLIEISSDDSDMETETEVVPETPSQSSSLRDSIPSAPDRLRMFSRKYFDIYYSYIFVNFLL